jgi:hypothetical protein
MDKMGMKRNWKNKWGRYSLLGSGKIKFELNGKIKTKKIYYIYLLLATCVHEHDVWASKRGKYVRSYKRLWFKFD